MISDYKDILAALEKTSLKTRFVLTPDDWWLVYDEFRENLKMDTSNIIAPHGQTKGVINIPNLNYVIKIPFTGCSYHTSPCDDCNKYHYPVCEYCGGRNCEELVENPYCHANSSESYFWDYCFSEVTYYRAAKRRKVENCFAKIRPIKKIGMFNIYIQEKAEKFSKDPLAFCGTNIKENKTTSKILKEKMSDYDYVEISESIDLGFLTKIRLMYGVKVLDNFLNFIKEEGINDLHLGNLGIIGDRPVVIDYSGFNDWSNIGTTYV